MKRQPLAPLRLLTTPLMVAIGLAVLAIAPAQAVGPEKHIVVDIETDGQTYYRVLSQKTKTGELPKRSALTLQEGAAYVELQDASGQVIDTQTVPDPTLIYFDYATSPGQPLQGGVHKLAKTQFRLELPYRKGAQHQLSFYALKRKSGRKAHAATRSKLHDSRSGRAVELPSTLSAEATTSVPLDPQP